MSEQGKLLDKTTIQFERLLPGPIERVWSYLTDGKKRAAWFSGGATELKPGGKVEFHFDHRKLTSPDDDKPSKKHEPYSGEMRFEGRVIRAEPPTLLIWEWPSEGEGGAKSVVTFALEPRGDRVLLTLTEAKLKTRETVIGNAAGWHTHLDYLEAILGGTKRPRFWASIARREADYEKLFSA
jgi:uncharacterized protein YndB with AHSA1/START domain